MASVLRFLCFLCVVVEILVETGRRRERSFPDPADPREMADEEHQSTIGGDLQEKITYFNAKKLHLTKTEEKLTLPDQATIEREKKMVQEEAGKRDGFLIGDGTQ